MALTVKQLDNAKPAAKAQKLFDGGGLFLLVSPAGGKWWRLKYRFAGRERLLSLGTYPDVGLKQARERRDDARRLLVRGIDPGTQRKAQKAEQSAQVTNSFEAVAREWFATKETGWEQSHSSRILRRLERELFPYLGTRPIAEITAPELLVVLRRIEARNAVETARRCAQYCQRVCQYAIITGRLTLNPAAGLVDALAVPVKSHHAAVTAPAALGELLRALEGYRGAPLVRVALRLAPLVFVRPGELRQAEWAELDLETATWTIPAHKMKRRNRKSDPGQDHVVPLAEQAVALLREAAPLSANGRYIFPGERTRERPITDNTLGAALRRLGYSGDQVTVHGFRATARTLLDEVLGVRPDYIEHQLAHAVRDPNGRAYNRTAFLAERRAMMQQWADYLDSLKADKVVSPRPGSI